MSLLLRLLLLRVLTRSRTKRTAVRTAARLTLGRWLVMRALGRRTARRSPDDLSRYLMAAVGVAALRRVLRSRFAG